MKYFLFCLLCCSILFADENNSESTITVHVTAVVEVPADIVIFRVSIRCEEKDPKVAFEEHKRLEAKLLELISEYDIPDSNITYSLLNISSRKNTRRYQGKEQDERTFHTAQTVHIAIYDVNSYLKFQVDLLENGFDQFGSRFSSTQVEGLKEAGYIKALRLAEEEAVIISKNMGRSLGQIEKVITETGDRFRFEQSDVTEFISRDVTKNLTDIKQTVSTRTKLRVIYKLN